MLSHNDELWKEKVFALEYKLKDQLAAYRSLKHKWTTTSEKNEKLNKLLVQSRKDAEVLENISCKPDDTY